jgi:YesN/AraC family two-component response regulator
MAISDQQSAKRLRVLVADDSAEIRNSLSHLIARLSGVELVGTAANGLEALKLVRELKPDVITLDIRMPGMNGLAVLAAIAREPVKPRVMVLTSFVTPEYRQECLNLGAEHFFDKTTEFELALDLLAESAARLNPSD